MPTHPGTPQAENGLSVLLIDCDPRFVKATSRLIAEEGHQAWAAEDLLAAANFLADHSPDVIFAEFELLQIDGADPLGDLRARAPGVRTIITAVGAPDERFAALCRSHDVFGFYDKTHGLEALRLWLCAAHATVRQLKTLRDTRVGMRKVLDAVPDLHRLQSLEEVQAAILGWLTTLMGAERAFVAARMSDPVGKPPIEGFTHSTQTTDDYVIGAANADAYPVGARVDKLRSIPGHLVSRAVEDRTQVIDDRHGVLPLSLAEHVLGLAYAARPGGCDRDLEVLQIFAGHAAAAIRNAALFELATVDATTRVFQKAFTLDRLRETLKLAWRKAFPVAVLMIDIDRFKELNDHFGHVVGDRALRQLGTLLKENVRDSDVVGRFGGDEFLVILIDANHLGADIVADRLHRVLEQRRGRAWPDGVPPLKTSMGLATLEPGEVPPRELGFPKFQEVVERLVAEADAAMYQARREGKIMQAGATLTWTDFART